MADFDPDTYLQSTGKGGFDPDAYLGSTKKEAGAKASPPPKEKSGFDPQILPLSSGGKGMTAADVKAALYGAATGTAGTLGDIGLPFMNTEDFRKGLAKVTGIQEPGPSERGAETVGEYLPMLAGGLKAGAEAAPLAARGLGRMGAFATDVARGLKPRGLLDKIGTRSSISDVGERITSKIEKNLEKLVKERGAQATALFDKYLAKGKAAEGEILADYKMALQDYYARGVAGGKMSPEQINAVRRAADRIGGHAPEMGREAPKAPDFAGRKILPKGNQTPPSPSNVKPGIGALEKERRIWNDIANGYDVKGAEGITAQAAKDIRDLLTASIKKFVPEEFEKAMTGYKELSEPINRFNTALGKKATAEADEFLPEMSKTDPAAVPRAFFKSRRSAQELKALTGDSKFAEQAARDHVANELSQARTRDQVSAYLSKNADWLQEFPTLRKELQDAAKSIGRGEGAKKVGKYAAGAEALHLGNKVIGGF